MDETDFAISASIHEEQRVKAAMTVLDERNALRQQLAASDKRVRELTEALEKIAAIDPTCRETCTMVWTTNPPRWAAVSKCVDIARLALSHTKEGENA